MLKKRMLVLIAMVMTISILGGTFYTYYVKNDTIAHIPQKELLSGLGMSEKALRDKLSQLAGTTVALDDYEYYYYAEIKDQIFKTEGCQNSVVGDIAFYYVKDKGKEVICVFPVTIAFHTMNDLESVETIVPASYVVNSNKLVMNAKIKYENKTNPSEVAHKTDWVIMSIDL